MNIRLILAIAALLVGVAFIIAGVIPDQITTYSLNSLTGTFQQSTFRAGELRLIYTFSKG